MTRSKNSAKKLNFREMLAGQEDFLRSLIQQIVQQVLEAEMDEAVGAEKGERTPNRLGYRSGYSNRTLMTRVGKLELRVPLTFYGLPLSHHKHLKSTNLLERLNEELKRRTLVVRIFPNAASCLRLSRAL